MEAGLAHGLEEDPSVICLHGSVLDGCSAEEHAGGFSGHPLGTRLRGSATVFDHTYEAEVTHIRTSPPRKMRSQHWKSQRKQ